MAVATSMGTAGINLERVALVGDGMVAEARESFTNRCACLRIYIDGRWNGDLRACADGYKGDGEWHAILAYPPLSVAGITVVAMRELMRVYLQQLVVRDDVLSRLGWNQRRILLPIRSDNILVAVATASAESEDGCERVRRRSRDARGLDGATTLDSAFKAHRRYANVCRRLHEIPDGALLAKSSYALTLAAHDYGVTQRMQELVGTLHVLEQRTPGFPDGLTPEEAHAMSDAYNTAQVG